MEPMPVTSTPSCLQHPHAAVTGYCVRCGRPVCDLCTFWMGSGLFCPECISAGPSADERSSVRNRGVVSMLLGVLGFLGVVGLLAIGAMGLGDDSRALASGLGILVCALVLGGVSVGLIAREGAARTRSVLPLIGVILNGVLLALLLVFIVVAAF